MVLAVMLNLENFPVPMRAKVKCLVNVEADKKQHQVKVMVTSVDYPWPFGTAFRSRRLARDSEIIKLARRQFSMDLFQSSPHAFCPAQLRARRADYCPAKQRLRSNRSVSVHQAPRAVLLTFDVISSSPGRTIGDDWKSPTRRLWAGTLLGLDQNDIWKQNTPEPVA
ncbi:uncharacterized protein BKA78DRAFT_365872 [Phyllosticta capitalensis]|uniref:uncharacterized protein n=1 Tax=Phyllosticta capitalensis TaxID=121624 RepID=UPI003130942F